MKLLAKKGKAAVARKIRKIKVVPEGMIRKAANTYR